MLIVLLVLTALTLLLCIGEAYHERDWPRDTFKYFLWMGAVLLFWLKYVERY